MTQEDKQLLLKDLCSRLPYGVKIELTWWVMDEGTCINTSLEPDHIEQLLNDEYGDTEIKPYLRPMSSMTEEEEEEYHNLCYEEEREEFEFGEWTTMAHYHDTINSIDYLNSIHIDYRGLITKGLAIEVTKENNPYQF